MSAPALTAADRFAIEDLISTYHWALDTADVEGFADTFAEAGSVELQVMNHTTRYSGRAGLIDLAESLRVWDRFPGCQHYAGQLLMEGGGDQCRVRSFVFMTDSRGKPPYEMRFAGRSDDRLVRLHGQWLFEQRLIRLWQGDALRNVQLELLT
ncbi:MAG TPA: nuclear transport factor 2 family protein [Ramlibacter sp.]|nr:nuclear transport factor 2 family protein [Ramlibacter sp.]